MKKIIALSFVAGLIITACGTSAKEKEAQRIQDSIRQADSLAAVEAAAQQVAADSTAAVVADSTAAEAPAQ
jgi:hypothetical protein